MFALRKVSEEMWGSLIRRAARRFRGGSRKPRMERCNLRSDSRVHGRAGAPRSDGVHGDWSTQTFMHVSNHERTFLRSVRRDVLYL